jgi:dihydroorotase
VQHALLSVLELVQQGELTLTQVVEKTAHAPAQRFAIAKRGFLREGYFADLVLLDLTQSTQVQPADVLYHCQWSPLLGETLPGRICSTFVNGVRRYHQGQLLPLTADWGQVQPLRFMRDEGV